MDTINYYAFSDESRHNKGRYRAIGMISFPFDQLEIIEKQCLKICSDHGINNLKNFKWVKLKNDKKLNAAKSTVEYIFNKAILRELRVDILIWDTHDRRHKIVGRDDSENLARMYYHLYKNVFLTRWPENSIWNVYPDQNTAIDWNKLKEILMTQGLVAVMDDKSVNGRRQIILKNKVVLDIYESNPLDHPIIQVADLFAGMGSYSWEEYNKFEEWIFQKSGQKRLFNNFIKPSNADNHKCFIMDDFKSHCKKCGLSISLNSTRGFKTHNPNDPINFWLYTPQSEHDKAPLKNKSFGH